jgi:hypothetical protein
VARIHRPPEALKQKSLKGDHGGVLGSIHAGCFVVGPLAHGRLEALAARDPEAVLRRVSRAHFVLLAASVVTILGAFVGAHGRLEG